MSCAIRRARWSLPAGTETISTALSGTIYLLSKLDPELNSHLTPEKDITTVTVSKMGYLQGVLDEAMRMYPPFSGGLRRQAPRGGEIHLIQLFHSRRGYRKRRSTSGFQLTLQFHAARSLRTRLAADGS
ncbi:hypothetical protein ABVK25_006711 [Lepraria finkii]|uniref:Uncharacterized protein n=1 Tax=Lepraria finkii TaxID=1340010 RepID=A0ABR4B887_9LECA